jgi:hypothetical protein
MLDKARADLAPASTASTIFIRAVLAPTSGSFTGLDAMKFKEFVATGATTKRLIAGTREHNAKESKAIIKWNNEMRGLRLCDLSGTSAGILRNVHPAVLPSAE